MTPSLKAAQTELRRRLERIDDMYDRACASLPDGHTWRDIDLLETERCKMAIEAHDDFAAAAAEWDAYVLAHADDEDCDEMADLHKAALNCGKP